MNDKDFAQEEDNLTQEQFERILKNPDDETSQVAKELYPEDAIAQEHFISDINRFVDALFRGFRD